jgi:hypothetical protein
MTRILLVIGLVAVLVGCLALVMLVNTFSAAADSAVDKALASGAADGQRVTAVCVGLNIGSCRTTQQSTRPAAGGGDDVVIPWPMKLLAVAVGCPLLLGAVIWLWGRSAEV